MLSMGLEGSGSFLKGFSVEVLEGYDLESPGPIWKVSGEFDWFRGFLKVSA